jgi:hypothetical protein
MGRFSEEEKLKVGVYGVKRDGSYLRGLSAQLKRFLLFRIRQWTRSFIITR